MSADRPLTDPQERALIALAEGHDRDPDAWLRGWRIGHAGTLAALERRGLAESRYFLASEFDWRITEAGLALCRSMGD